MQYFNNTPEQEIYDCIKAFQESAYKAIELQVNLNMQFYRNDPRNIKKIL